MRHPPERSGRTYRSRGNASKILAVTTRSHREAPIGDVVLRSLNLQPVLRARYRLKGCRQRKAVIIHRGATKGAGGSFTGISPCLILHQRCEYVGLGATGYGSVNGHRKIKDRPPEPNLAGCEGAPPVSR